VAYSEDVLVSDDVDLECVPREVEQGTCMLQYGQWKRINARRYGVGKKGARNMKEWVGKRRMSFG
jgi:hypothetical protein